MIKKNIFTFFFMFIITAFNFCDAVRISQIDATSLLFDQNIKLYLSVTDEKGLPAQNLSKENFEIFESIDGKKYKSIKNVTDFRKNSNIEDGINFLLLIDNSGSMYYDMNGKETADVNNLKITCVKRAVSTFISSITNKKDNIGLAVYNSYFTILSKPISINEKDKIIQYMENIKKPEGDEGYTEIYSSLNLSCEEFISIKGRKVIIILTDGQNEPYYKGTGKEHKIFGKEIIKYDAPIMNSLKEGISVFAINFNNIYKNNEFNQIAVQTGGVVFDANDEEELKNVYFTINKQILNEYLISYKATMDPVNKKFVKVIFNKDNNKYSGTSLYFSSTLFGTPIKKFNPFILLTFFLACLILFILSLIKFKNKMSKANLEVLSTQVGKALNKTIVLSKDKTIIGGSENADMTIVGAPALKENHATIQFDGKKNQYTIIAQGDLKVNNKSVKTKILEPGDVINAGGATIVFDDGLIKKK